MVVGEISAIRTGTPTRSNSARRGPSFREMTETACPRFFKPAAQRTAAFSVPPSVNALRKTVIFTQLFTPQVIRSLVFVGIIVKENQFVTGLFEQPQNIIDRLALVFQEGGMNLQP